LPAERTQRLLDKLRAARPEVEIETIEVLQHPRRALRDTCACAQCRCGVFMIPALIPALAAQVQVLWASDAGIMLPHYTNFWRRLVLSHVNDNLGMPTFCFPNPYYLDVQVG